MSPKGPPEEGAAAGYTPWLLAVRHSHDRLAARSSAFGAVELARRSYCSEWTVAQVLSHLGSQAEIFSGFLEAGLGGGDPPDRSSLGTIWERWDALPAAEQAAQAKAANERLLVRIEELEPERLESVRFSLFGQDVDAAGLLRLRLFEHAIHSWDVAVAFDPTERVPAEGVGLLLAGLGATAQRVGRPEVPGRTLLVRTTLPDAQFVLDTGTLSLRPGEDGRADGGVQLSSETLLRLVCGRLRELDPVAVDGVTRAELATIFPGF